MCPPVRTQGVGCVADASWLPELYCCCSVVFPTTTNLGLRCYSVTAGDITVASCSFPKQEVVGWALPCLQCICILPAGRWLWLLGFCRASCTYFFVLFWTQCQACDLAYWRLWVSVCRWAWVTVFCLLLLGCGPGLGPIPLWIQVNPGCLLDLQVHNISSCESRPSACAPGPRWEGKGLCRTLQSSQCQ